jgi:hypothetical protein
MREQNATLENRNCRDRKRHAMLCCVGTEPINSSQKNGENNKLKPHSVHGTDDIFQTGLETNLADALLCSSVLLSLNGPPAQRQSPQRDHRREACSHPAQRPGARGESSFAFPLRLSRILHLILSLVPPQLAVQYVVPGLAATAVTLVLVFLWVFS